MMRTLLMGQAAVFVADAVALGRLSVWTGLFTMAVLFLLGTPIKRWGE